jgi:uncharacterized delta-60 repeat protein
MRKLSRRVHRRAVGQAALLTVETLEQRRLLSAGSVDSSFGNGGLAMTDFTGSSTDNAINAVRLQDNKLVIVGGSNGLPVMARYNTNGSRDTTFGNGGVVHIDPSVLAGVAAVAEAPSGELVVAGNDSSGEAALAFFTADGSLDTSFGNSGVTVVPAAGSAFESIAFDSNGRVMAAASGNGDFAAVRLDNSGNLDPAFGNGGVATFDFGVGEDDAVTIANHDGSLLVAGVATQVSSGAEGDTGQDAGFVQFTDDTGILDTNFNTSGSQVLNGLQYPSSIVTALKTLSTGDILVGGTDFHSDFFVTRLFDDGSVDSSFNQNVGFNVTNIGDSNPTTDAVSSIDLDSANRIVLMGSADSNIAIARYNNDGSLDTSFASNGRFIGPVEAVATGTMNHQDDSIIFAGSVQGPVDGDFAQIKLNADTTLNNSFGSGGTATDGFTNSQVDVGSAVAQQSDGKLVVAGSTQNSNGQELIAVTRYLPNGALDTSFGNGGRATLSVTGQDEARGVVIGSTGKIFVAFTAGFGSSDEDFGVACFNSNGTVDTSFGTGGATVISRPTQDNQVVAMGLSPDGSRIYVAGTEADDSGDSNFELAGFSTGGNELFDNVVPFAGSNQEALAGMAVGADGSIALGGVTSDGATVEFAVAKLSAGGVLDPSFNGNGEATTQDSGFDAGGAVAVDGAGNVYITGFDSTTGDDAVIKFDPSGNRVTSGFGDAGANGVAHLTIGTASVPTSIAISASGKIVLAGTDAGAEYDDFAIARLNADGSVDNTFGSDGQIIFSQPFPLDVGGMTLQADGNIVVAGAANTDDFAIARFNANDGVVATPAPVARAGADQEVNEGGTVNFDGSTSTGDGLSFAWDLNGDGVFDDAFTPTASFAYPDGPASITVSLQVTDSEHRTSVDTLTVTVDNVAPTLTVTGAGTANEGSLYSVNLGSSDPGADTISSWTINWGDGHTDLLSGNPSTASHTYADNGNYTIISSATDEDGTYSAPNASVAVANVAPTLTVTGTGTANEGSPYTVNLGSSDPGADTISSWTINWGDGHTDVISGHPSAASHTYADNGNYTIVSSATDEDGTYSAPNASVAVANVAPTLTVTGTGTANEGSPYTVNLGSNDPGADTISSWTINWGDGHTDILSGHPSSATHTYANNGNYTIVSSATDEDGTYSAPNAAVAVANVAPTPTINGAPASSPEATAISLTSSVSDPGSLDTFTYAWSVTKNGNPFATAGTASSYNFTPDDNGTYIVSLKVTDNDGGTNTTTKTISVTDVAPTAAVSGPGALQTGQSGTFVLGASDPSPIDQNANFTFQIDWDGNGTVDQTVVGPIGTNVAHSFASPGNFNVKVTAIDKDGVASASPATLAVAVTNPAPPPLTIGAQLVADPLNPGKTELLVTGGTGNDAVILLPGANGSVNVTVAGGTGGTFSPTGRIVVNGGSGNDIIIAIGLTRPVEVYGGDGNDILYAGSASDILVGGAGDDLLIGGAAGTGRDMLLGGAGADTLVGSVNDDILIAGTTSYDNDPASLNAIMAEWTSTRSYADRVANLRGTNSGSAFTARLNGNIFLKADAGSSSTVFDDGVRDVLSGGAGRDWFLFNSNTGVKDSVMDESGNETGTDV